MENNIDIYLKALVVGDYKVTRLTFQKLLNSMGYCVSIANHGMGALDLFEKCHFDLIIFDIHTSKLDGMAVTEIIRCSAHNNKNIFIIGITEDEEYSEKAYRTGINKIFTKPLYIEGLKKCVSSLTKSIQKTLIA